MMRPLFLFAVLCCGLPPLGAQNPFAGVDSLQYVFDLSRNFYRDSSVAAAERVVLLRRIEQWVAELERQGEQARRDPRVLERLIVRADSLARVSNKQLAYYTLRTSIDQNDRAAARALALVQAPLGSAMAAFFSLLGSINDSGFTALARQLPSLGRWRFLVQQARPQQARPTSAREDSLVAALTEWPGRLFASLNRETDLGSVATAAGRRDVRTEATALANDPDRRVREQTHHAQRGAIRTHAGTYAGLLIATVRAQETASRLVSNAGARERSYRGRFLSRSTVDSLFAAIARTAEINKRYERARVAHISRVAGIDTVQTWDLVVAEPGMAVPRFTITQAANVFRAATEPLGPDYRREVDALLDPRNGRLDLVPRAGRVMRPGFSTGAVGYPSVFFQGRYGGYVEDLVILVHEGGHSVQNMLMTAHDVPSLYAFGPGYFTESFAGFNELLVLDYLARTAPDRAHKIYYLERWLDQATQLYKGAREAQLEDVLYDSIPAGRINSAADIEQLTQAIGARYSIWYYPGSERVLEWVSHSMAISRPFYRINYVLSGLLALNYFAAFDRDPRRFAGAYGGLLANGYDAPPAELLREHLGMGFDANELVAGATAVIAAKVEELRRLYDQP